MADDILEQEIKFVFSDSELNKFANQVASKITGGATKTIGGEITTGGGAGKPSTVEVLKTVVEGYKGAKEADLGLIDSIKTGLESGKEARAVGGEGAGGKSAVSLLGQIAVGIGVVAAFWTAIGPILTPFVRLMGALMLIVLMPFIKAIMPVIIDKLPLIVSTVEDVGKGIASILTWFKENFGSTGAFIAAVAGLLTLNAVVSLATGAISGALSLLLTTGGKLIIAGLQATVSLLSAGLTALAAALGVSVVGAGLFVVIAIGITWLGLEILDKFLEDVDNKYKKKQEFLKETGMTENYTVLDSVTGKQVQANVDISAEAFRPIQTPVKISPLPSYMRGPNAIDLGTSFSTTPPIDYSSEGQVREIKNSLRDLPVFGNIFTTTLNKTGTELTDNLIPNITDTADSLDTLVTSSDDLKITTEDLKGTKDNGFVGLKDVVNDASTSLKYFKSSVFETVVAMGTALRQAQMAAQQASINASASASALQSMRKQSTYNGGFWNR